MGDIVILSSSRWRLQNAVKVLNGLLNSLPIRFLDSTAFGGELLLLFEMVRIRCSLSTPFVGGLPNIIP